MGGTSSVTRRSRRGRGIGAAAAEIVGETVGVEAQAPINLVKHHIAVHCRAPMCAAERNKDVSLD